MQQLDYGKLERNLIDVIKEEQAKLGYYREDLRLYYPLSSLNHFWGTNLLEEEMQQALEQMREPLGEKLGVVEVSHKEERFCIHIPPEGVAYVHEHTLPNEFIFELVKLVSQHGCTMEQVHALFLKRFHKVYREKIRDGEFDEIIYCEDNQQDPYYYCFKQEGEHMIYHRFLPEDYAEFGFLTV